MVAYNENWEPFKLTNLRDWPSGAWKILARSWLSDGQDLCKSVDWSTCPDAAGELEIAGRSMALLISPNN
jgi:hypothetical protein